MESNMGIKVKGIFIEKLDECEGSIHGFDDFQSFLRPLNNRIIAPRSALIEDEVWVVHGASKPLLLRPEGPEDMYGFRGEVLVCNAENGTFTDVMFGKAITLAEREATENDNDVTEEIWLV
jgi:hypothetical protein